jgi:hypothetical protein
MEEVDDEEGVDARRWLILGNWMDGAVVLVELVIELIYIML